MKSIHALRPQGSVAIEPLVKLGERPRAQAVDPELCLLVHLDESCVAEDPQVSRGTRTSDWQQRRELTRRSRTLAQGIQDGSPTRVGEGLQDGVHGGFVTCWVRNCQVTYLPPVDGRLREDHAGHESPVRGTGERDPGLAKRAG